MGHRCVQHRHSLVPEDPWQVVFLERGCCETRRGSRLNLGHTLAHALESVGGYELLHGEAVSVGLVFAGALAGAMERVDTATVERYRDLVAALDLPTRVPDGANAEQLLASMRRDKKAMGGLTFVLPNQSGELEIVHDPDPLAISEAFHAVGVGG